MSIRNARREFEVWVELYFHAKKSRNFRNTDLLVDLLKSDAPFFLTPEIKRELIEILEEYRKLRDAAVGKNASQTVDESWIFWLHYKNQRDGLNGRQSKEQIAEFLQSSFDRIDKVIQRKFLKAKQENELKWAEAYLSLKDKPPKMSLD